MGAVTADGQQLRRHGLRGVGVKFRAKHGLGQGGGDAVQQHRAAFVDVRQSGGQAGAALDSPEAPALPVGNVPQDTLVILAVTGRHGGPVVEGSARRQMAAQALGGGAFATLAAADQ